MKKTRLVALDVDGTLLDDRKQLPSANREAVQKAARRGVLVAVASGRMAPRLEPIEEALGVDAVLMAYNGAKVVGRRQEGRPLILHRPVPSDVAGEIMDFARAGNYPLNFYHDDRLFAVDRPEHRELIDLYAARTGSEYHLREDLETFRGVAPTKLIVLAWPPERDRLYEEFRVRFQGRAFITRSEPEYLEIMAPGVDKGDALLRIAAHHGIDPGETVAVGDSDNDVELLRAAGLGVAMANAPDRVKETAGAVTTRDNNDAGAAEAIERWVLDGVA